MNSEKFKSGTLIKDLVVYDKDETILIKAPDNGTLTLYANHCGDHIEWYIIKSENGQEKACYNLRFVAEFTYW